MSTQPTPLSYGVFEDAIPLQSSIWTSNTTLPEEFGFESAVYIKTHKHLFTKFKPAELKFSAPNLYLIQDIKEGKEVKKVVRSVNLKSNYCKLYSCRTKNQKYRYKFVLQHRELVSEFHFMDAKAYRKWFSVLRKYCIMRDFPTAYKNAKGVIKRGSIKTGWTQNVLSGELVTVNVQHLREDVSEEVQKIEKQIIFNKVHALRNVDHPNILKIKEVHELRKMIVLFTELTEGLTLLQYILSKESLPEKDVSYIIKTLLQAVQALHDKNIVHRNLKPENIFFQYSSSGHILKIMDLGFSCTLNPEDQTPWAYKNNCCNKGGTPGYIPPETLLNKEALKAGDIFSVGVILYTCLTGEAMFKGKDIEEIVKKNMNVEIEQNSFKWLLLSDNAKQLILQMTDKDPNKRGEISEILQHPFFEQWGKSSVVASAKSQDSFGFKSPTFPDPKVQYLRISSLERKSTVTNDQLVNEGALRGLVIPPSFTDIANKANSGVPEFYFETQEIQDANDSIMTADLKVSAQPSDVTNTENMDGYVLEHLEFPLTPEFNHEPIDDRTISVFDLDTNSFYEDCPGPEERFTKTLATNVHTCFPFPETRTSPFNVKPPAGSKMIMSAKLPSKSATATPRDFMEESFDGFY